MIIWNTTRKNWNPSRSKKEEHQKSESVGVRRLPSKKEGGAMNLLLVENRQPWVSYLRCPAQFPWRPVQGLQDTALTDLRGTAHGYKQLLMRTT